MARGLSKKAQYARTVRFLDGVENICRIFPDAIVTRNGKSGNVTVRNGAKDSNPNDTRLFQNSFYVRLEWGNMSNGESVGLVHINGRVHINERWPGWGDIVKILREAYDKL